MLKNTTDINFVFLFFSFCFCPQLYWVYSKSTPSRAGREENEKRVSPTPFKNYLKADV